METRVLPRRCQALRPTQQAACPQDSAGPSPSGVTLTRASCPSCRQGAGGAPPGRLPQQK